MASLYSLYIDVPINTIYYNTNLYIKVSAHALHCISLLGDLNPTLTQKKSPVIIEMYDQADQESLLYSD